MNRQKNWDEISALQKEYKENLRNQETEKALQVNHMIYERLFDVYMTTDEILNTKLFDGLSDSFKKYVKKELEELSELAEKIKWNI